jgi:putative Holliday junction resolvase
MNLPSPRASRIVSIDFGLKRIGMALSDEQKIIASPWTIVIADRRAEQTAALVMQQIEKIQKERGCTIVSIVVGMPLLMNGKVGLLGDEVKHFIDLLQKCTPIPIISWDERLSSVQADRSLREMQMTRKQRAKRVDEVAAVIILQSYLDRLLSARESEQSF